MRGTMVTGGLVAVLVLGGDALAQRPAEGTGAQQQDRPPAATAPLTSVALQDYEIVMPETLTAGSQAFQVSNAGSVPHSLEVEGQGMERRFATPLAPGEVRVLEVVLEPGTYRVYCPVDNHAKLGMERRLTVRAAPPRSRAEEDPDLIDDQVLAVDDQYSAGRRLSDDVGMDSWIEEAGTDLGDDDRERFRSRNWVRDRHGVYDADFRFESDDPRLESWLLERDVGPEDP